MGNRILLFGSGGFVGSYLKYNLEVVPITRTDCNLLDEKSVNSLLKKYSPDIVINSACNIDLSLDNFNNKCFIDNIKIFSNFYNNKNLFHKFINIGSGAEFDRTHSIDFVKEYDILNVMPKDHYGLSKNIISRICLQTENFYTIRLFGCLHHTDKKRLFNKILNEDNISIKNRKFDYFCLEDLIPVLQYFISEEFPIKDVNLVYKEKCFLKQIIENFCIIHNISRKINYIDVDINYTGSSELIDSLGLDFIGLQRGLEKYII